MIGEENHAYLIRTSASSTAMRTVPCTDVMIDGDRIAEPGERAADLEVDGTRQDPAACGLIDAHTHAYDGDLCEALRFGVTTELEMNNCRPSGRPAQAGRRARRRGRPPQLQHDRHRAGGHPSQLMTPTCCGHSAATPARGSTRSGRTSARPRRSWRPGWRRAWTT
ncbi:hypothetical protein GCM10020220_075120 [Nonomuraea rubra]|uniref:hypothetical protein n=1 Tax=Nonomuraea rubra TaxID=46180 RepID=UPI0031EC8127